MNKIFCIALFLNFLAVTAQEKEFKKAYIDLLNYVPDAIARDESFKCLGHKYNFTPNSIERLRVLCDHSSSLNKEETKILEGFVNQLAVAFFLEGKFVLIHIVGGAGGCPEEVMLDKEIEGHKVTILRFCYGCVRYNKAVNFSDVFNNRMETLMKIKKPFQN